MPAIFEDRRIVIWPATVQSGVLPSDWSGVQNRIHGWAAADEDPGENNARRLCSGARQSSTRKSHLQVARLDFFGYFTVYEPQTSHLAVHAGTLGRAFSSAAGTYGNGVKSVTAELILTDPSGLGRLHKTRRARFSPGTRILKGHGLTVKVEDTLEFSIRPSFETISTAANEKDLAAAIVPALALVAPELLKLRVPDFDMQRFLSDLEVFLRRSAVTGAYVQ